MSRRRRRVLDGGRREHGGPQRMNPEQATPPREMWGGYAGAWQLGSAGWFYWPTLATFYLGGKIGFHYYKQELSGGGEKASESDSSGTYSALIGFKFAVAEKTDLVIGYEITKYWSDVDPYHFITVGFSWSF